MFVQTVLKNMMKSLNSDFQTGIYNFLKLLTLKIFT